ncbi:hypothetical protein VB780_12280 [Leptolyngbya sp. CCNP1308]|nr:hypothetical protein [Leptolyngbya sp. CCNP1308]
MFSKFLSSGFEFCREIKAKRSDIAKIYLATIFVFILTWSLGQLLGLSSYELVSDPAEIANISPFVGLISILGDLCWAASAAICIFFSFVTCADETLHRKWFLFFLLSGFLSIWLALDDLLQIHEYIGASIANINFFHLALESNLMEGFVFLIYFGCFTIYITYFRRHFKKTECLFLILAFFLFAFSILIDTLISDAAFHGKYVLEKLPKLLGIVSWLVYFSRAGIMLIKRQLLMPRKLG